MNKDFNMGLSFLSLEIGYSLANYKPIFMLGFACKMTSKILANRF